MSVHSLSFTQQWSGLASWRVTSGNHNEAKKLLDRGANIEARSTTLMTPLHLAVSNRHIQAVEILLQSGADIEPHRSSGNSSLHFAASNRFLGTVEVLLISGSNTEARNLSCDSRCGALSWRFGGLGVAEH